MKSTRSLQIPAIACLLIFLSCTLHSQEKEGTRIVMLGTGTPNADPDRSGPCVAILVNGSSYLVDAGPGIVRRAASAAKKGIVELQPQFLKRAFITHLHSDHTLGLPDLIFTPWVLERTEPLELFGPPGLKAMTESLEAAYKEDVDIRINGLEPANTTGYNALVHEIGPGIVYQDEQVTVKAFKVHHGSWQHAFGYRFETPDRVIVISGDCTPSEELIANAKDCDVLIHEVYSEVRFHERPPEWQRYHKDFHTSTVELGAIANQVRPKLLVLYHQLFWGATPDDLVNEVRRVYNGKVISANDLDIF